MRTSLALIFATALAAPALASPYDWHTYPHGDRVLAVEPSDTWLLLDRPAWTWRRSSARWRRRRPGRCWAR